MIKIIILIVKKAFGAIFALLAAIGSITYLIKFNFAEFLEDNRPDSYFYGSMILFTLFCVICLFLSLRELQRSRQEDFKGKEDISSCNKHLDEMKLEIKNLKQDLEKKKNQLAQHNKHQDKEVIHDNLVVLKVFDPQLLSIINTIKNDLDNIQDKLIRAYKFNDGKVSPSHNNVFKSAKDRYLQCKYLIDCALEDYIKKFKLFENETFPLRKIFDNSTLQSLADTYRGETIAQLYYHDNNYIFNNINNDFDKLTSLLISFEAFLHSELIK